MQQSDTNLSDNISGKKNTQGLTLLHATLNEKAAHHLPSTGPQVAQSSNSRTDDYYKATIIMTSRIVITCSFMH